VVNADFASSSDRSGGKGAIAGTPASKDGNAPSNSGMGREKGDRGNPAAALRGSCWGNPAPGRGAAAAGRETAAASPGMYAGSPGATDVNPGTSAAMGNFPAVGMAGIEGSGMPNCGRRVSKSGAPCGRSGIDGATPAGKAGPGCERKSSLASRANVATSGSEPVRLFWFSGSPSGSRAAKASASFGSLVLMVLSDFNVREHTQRIFGKYRRRAIQRDQVRGHRVAVNPHKTY